MTWWETLNLTRDDFILLFFGIAVVLTATMFTLGAIIKSLIDSPKKTAPFMTLFSGIAGAITAFVMFFVLTFTAMGVVAFIIVFLVYRGLFHAP